MRQLEFQIGCVFFKFNIKANRHLENSHLKNISTDFSRILLCWCIIALPSLSAIKYIVIDNKTANINDKKLQFIHCVDSHASRTVKRWYYSASRWQVGWKWLINPRLNWPQFVGSSSQLFPQSSWPSQNWLSWIHQLVGDAPSHRTFCILSLWRSTGQSRSPDSTNKPFLTKLAQETDVQMAVLFLTMRY